jgi:hypothetical protein
VESCATDEFTVPMVEERELDDIFSEFRIVCHLWELRKQDLRLRSAIMDLKNLRDGN